MNKHIFSKMLLCYCVFVIAGFCGCSNKEGNTEQNVERIVSEINQLNDEYEYDNALSELTEKNVTSIEGITYYRLQQNYQGIPVYGRTVVYAETENQEAVSVNGNVVDVDENLSLTPTATQAVIEEKIVDYITDILLVTEIEEIEISEIDETRINIFNTDEGISHLAYAIDSIFCNDTGLGIYEFLVDAHSGEVLFSNSLFKQDSMTGTLQGQNKAHPNVTYEEDNTEYRLFNSERNLDASTVDTEQIFHFFHSMGDYKKINVAVGNSSTDFNKTLVTWTEGENPDAEAVDAYVNAQIAYQYFEEVLGNISTDGEGKAAIHVATGMDYVKDENGIFGYRTLEGNAYSYSSTENDWYTALVIGVGKNGNASYADDLDTVAHEYMHGVTKWHANLDYSGESGAIDEALSDIFGELVEYWHTKKENVEYEIDWMHNSRNIADPESVNYPVQVSDSNNSGEDFVHGYSTVISHTAYLMWNGINGNSDKKLTTDEIAQLWYHAMLMMPSDCDFEMCRTLVELAARNMKLSDSKIECIGESFDMAGIYTQKFAYQISENASLIVTDAKNAPYGNYTLYIAPVQIQSKSYVLLGDEINVDDVIGNSQHTCVITSEEPYTLDLEEGVYAIAVVDNADDKKNCVRTFWVCDEGADTFTIQTEFESPEENELLTLLTTGYWEDVNAQWDYVIKFEKDGIYTEHELLTSVPETAVFDSGTWELNDNELVKDGYTPGLRYVSISENHSDWIGWESTKEYLNSIGYSGYVFFDTKGNEDTGEAMCLIPYSKGSGDENGINDGSAQTTGNQLTAQQIEIVKEELGIPSELDVTVVQGDPSYWEAGECWEIYIEFHYNGKSVASASVEKDTLELLRNIFMYENENTEENGNSSSDITALRKIMENYSYGEDYDDYSEYYLYDLNRDGIDELIIQIGNCEAAYTYVFYDIKSNSYNKIGEVSGFHSDLRYDGNGKLYRVMGHMGNVAAYVITELDGGITEKTIYEESFDNNEDYVYPKEVEAATTLDGVYIKAVLK